MLRWFFIAVLSLSSTAWGQQNNVWVFGDMAGADFNGGPPVAMTTSINNALEATASVCDNQGNLLFYTDGATVWDATNAVMPNGSGLSGGPSATQTLIVKKPLDCSKYYIFHVADHTGVGDFRYTVVDMCLNGGMGDVVIAQKNILLSQPCGEKATAVMHANGVDVWVITHELNSNAFRAYPLTAAGVGAAVISNVGGFHANNHMIGPIKASHNGQKLAVANTFGPLFEMFDFNNSTGQVTNMVNLLPLAALYNNCVYGVEFSPNDQELYFTTCWTGNFVVQIDIPTMTTTQLATLPGPNQYFYGMVQTGPDGKLYIANNGQQSLHVINNPNTVGLGCNYIASGFPLNGGTTCRSGLPNFVPASFLVPNTNFVNLGNDTIAPCPLTPFTVNAGNICNSTYQWSTGATTNTINITGPGNYWVIVNNVCGSDTDTIAVTVTGQPLVNVSTNTPDVCPNVAAILTASGAASYVWSPASSLSATTGNSVAATPMVTTTYTVIGTDVCGSDTAYITITVHPPAQITTSGDTAICPGLTVPLSGGGGVGFVWSPAASLSAATGQNVIAAPTVTTTYTVVGTDLNGCTGTSTVTVTINPVPNITASNNTNLCLGDSLTLTAAGGQNFIWNPSGTLSSSTGSTVTAFPTVTTSYMVTGSNSYGCIDTGQVTVTVITASQAAFTSAAVPCESAIAFTNGSANVIGYLWSFGDGDSSTLDNPVHGFPDFGSYLVTLIVNPNTACADTVSSLVDFDVVDITGVYIPNAFTPNGDAFNEVWKIEGPVDCFYDKLQVYDRWGHIIWETDAPGTKDWDGRIDGGEVVPEGVYIYRLQRIGQKKKMKARIGHVTVIR